MMENSWWISNNMEICIKHSNKSHMKQYLI